MAGQVRERYTYLVCLDDFQPFAWCKTDALADCQRRGRDYGRYTEGNACADCYDAELNAPKHGPRPHDSWFCEQAQEC